MVRKATQISQPPATVADAEGILQSRFEHDAFHPWQRDLVEATLAGKDALCVSPTGSGKSLCFQAPAVLRAERGEGLTVVVSPLIALMQDQVRAMVSRGIPAVALHAELSDMALQRGWDSVREGGKQALLYVSPERLGGSRFAQGMSGVPIAGWAVDEAHCVSQWGHSFRPDYLGIRRAKERLSPQAPLMALTATASRRVRADIVRALKLKDPIEHVGDLRRPNLSYEVVPCEQESQRATRAEKWRQLEALIVDHAPEGNQSVLIYCATRNDTQALLQNFHDQGYSAAHYNAGLPPNERRQMEADFLQGRLRILVATNAFGMGIDVPDIRLIVHYQLPGSVAAYLQETGRAGRDGQPSHCALLYGGDHDAKVQRYFIEQMPDFNYVQRLRAILIANHQGGIDKLGQPFQINWGKLQGFLGVIQIDAAEQLRLQVAFKILKAYGLLREIEMDQPPIRGRAQPSKPYYMLAPFEKGSKPYNRLQRRLGLEPEIKIKNLEEMVEYAETEGADQDTLLRLFERE